MGWTRTLMSLVLHYFNTVLLLPPAVCHGPLAPLRYPPASSSALGAAAHPYPHGGIYSTLLKALSEHGGSRWSADLKRRVKPEQKYIKYMTEQYKKSSRMGRSLDRESQYNTLRLIQPLDKCLHRRKEFFMQSLSFSLDQVSDEEQLLKSVLLYSFDHDLDPSTTSACYLNIKEQEYSNRCPLCPGTHHSVNFTVHEHRRSGKNWMEVDVTPFLRPLFSVQKTNVHLLVNLTCPEGPGPTGGGHVGPVALTLHSAPLLLYLNDTSRLSRQRFHLSSAAGQRRLGESNAFDEQLQFKPESGLRIRRKRRRRRETPKSKRGGQSLDLQLPDLLPSSEFPTSDCALYDFKVRFSQLKLDHWIVFPPKYNPRYCRGICPRTMGFIYGSPVHTMVQNIIYEKLDSTVPRPTCIPSHYSPLSVMIFKEDGSYVYKEFEDMVATRCTCR